MRLALAIFLMLIGLALVVWNPWRPRDVSLTEKFAPYPATRIEPKAAPSGTSPVSVSPLGRPGLS